MFKFPRAIFNVNGALNLTVSPSELIAIKKKILGSHPQIGIHFFNTPSTYNGVAKVSLWLAKLGLGSI